MHNTVNNIKSKLQTAWDENPLAVITVVSAAAIAAAKLIESAASAQDSRSWKKEVDRRNRKDRNSIH